MFLKEPPLFNFHFSKTVLRTCMRFFRPIRPTDLEKIDTFWPKSQDTLKPASCGFHQQIHRPLFCWCANCQLRDIFQCRKIFVFFTKNDQNFFESCVCSRELRDFWTLLLWNCLCKLKFQNCFVATSWWSGRKIIQIEIVETFLRKCFRKFRFVSLGFCENVFVSLSFLLVAHRKHWIYCLAR